MVRARLVDEKAIVLYKQNKCHFQIGCAGHEAIGVAVGQVFKAGVDWFYPYYRDMAACAELGMTNEEFLLNVMNKEADPNSHGRQMPMHYGHKKLNIVNQSSPTGTQFLQAVGCAMAIKKSKANSVVYVSSGEGTCAQGDFHEALNWATRDKLPIVFVIQNNSYAISVHVSEQLSGESVYELVSGYNSLNRQLVDGTDYLKSFKAVEKAYNYAKYGKGAALIEAQVIRLQSHSISDNHLKYRTQEDITKETKKCPIAKLGNILIKEKIVTKSSLEKIIEEIKAEVDAASNWAEQQPDCDLDKAYSFNFSDDFDVYQSFPEPKTPTGEPVFMVDAINHALDEELTNNNNTYIYGQDVAHGKGGVFTVTAGLTAKFGNDRVFNSQLAESSIVGTAIGMATYGLKPIVEIQFADYIWTAMMQIRNELAMMRYRSANEFSCPAVVRVPVGGYINGGSYHSQNIEATFAHFPGLCIIYPSNATDAKGLLKTAIRCDDPVLFLEHKGLYRQVYAKGPEGDSEFLIPLGKAKVVKEGTDLTIVTWGAIVNKTLNAIKEYYENNTSDKNGISIEVIDVRTIVPLDIETIFNSVKKTGRVIIAHEDSEFMGFGAEIAAKIGDECFQYLDAPIKRVGMKNVAAIPHSGVLEVVILPQVNDLTLAIDEILSF